MYSYDTEIRFSNVDVDGKLKLSEAMRLIQDCSVEHVERRGMPTHVLAEKYHQAWIVNAWNVEIKRMPMLYEKVSVATIPYEFKGICGFRNYQITTPEGEKLMLLDSTWSLMDTKTLRPMKITEEARYGIEIDEKLDMNYEPRKISLPAELTWEVAGCEVVMNHHLDSNHHVNNAKYIEVALDYVPDDFKIKQMRVQYLISAVRGDKMVVKLARHEEKLFVSLENEEGSAYAVLEFK